jgi:hypothetical protein
MIMTQHGDIITYTTDNYVLTMTVSGMLISILTF